MEVKLTKNQRREVMAAGRAVYRKYGGDCDVSDVVDAAAAVLFDHEIDWNLADHEAIEISDYAYGVAAFIMPKHTW